MPSLPHGKIGFLHGIIFRTKVEERPRKAERWTANPRKRFPATDIFLFRPSCAISGMDDEVYEVGAGYYGGPGAVKDEVRTTLTLHRQQRTKQSSATAKRRATQMERLLLLRRTSRRAPDRLPTAALQSCSVITVNIMLSELSYSGFIEGRSRSQLTLGAPLKGPYILLPPDAWAAALICSYIC